MVFSFFKKGPTPSNDDAKKLGEFFKTLMKDPNISELAGEKYAKMDPKQKQDLLMSRVKEALMSGKYQLPDVNMMALASMMKNPAKAMEFVKEAMK